MENASKALIIAGAILISILLIAVGMMVYNSAMKPIGVATGSMDSISIQMFNQRFQGYDGTQKGSNIKELISEVITSNSTNEDGVLVLITMSGGTATSDNAGLSTMRSGVTNGKTYTVKIVYDINGAVSQIDIT